MDPDAHPLILIDSEWGKISIPRFYDISFGIFHSLRLPERKNHLHTKDLHHPLVQPVMDRQFQMAYQIITTVPSINRNKNEIKIE